MEGGGNHRVAVVGQACPIPRQGNATTVKTAVSGLRVQILGHHRCPLWDSTENKEDVKMSGRVLHLQLEFIKIIKLRKTNIPASAMVRTGRASSLLCPAVKRVCTQRQWAILFSFLQPAPRVVPCPVPCLGPAPESVGGAGRCRRLGRHPWLHPAGPAPAPPRRPHRTPPEAMSPRRGGPGGGYARLR